MITSGGSLPAKYVIHTVGPIYNEAKEQETELRSCYIESLKLAAEHGIKTISFPSISTGAYGYPLEEAAPVAISAVKKFLKDHPEIEEVTFALFNNETYNTYINSS